jgi:hypothetical protein
MPHDVLTLLMAFLTQENSLRSNFIHFLNDYRHASLQHWLSLQILKSHENLDDVIKVRWTRGRIPMVQVAWLSGLMSFGWSMCLPVNNSHFCMLAWINMTRQRSFIGCRATSCPGGSLVVRDWSTSFPNSVLSEHLVV